MWSQKIHLVVGLCVAFAVAVFTNDSRAEGFSSKVLTLTLHDSAVRVVGFAADGDTLISGGNDGKAVVTRLAQNPSSATIPHHGAVAALAVSPNGEVLATGDSAGKVQLRQLPKLTRINTIEMQDVVWALRFINADALIAGTGHESVDGPESDEIGRVRKVHVSQHDSAVVKTYDEIVVSLSFSRQTKRLAVGRSNGEADVVDIQSNMSVISSFRSDDDLPIGIALSPDGRILALPHYEQQLHVDPNVRPLPKPIQIGLWDVERSKIRQSLRGHNGPVLAIAFSPDGELLASGSWDRTVRLWNTDTGALMQTFRHPTKVWCVAFSPDGRSLASGSSDGKVRLWPLDEDTNAQTAVETANE